MKTFTVDADVGEAIVKLFESVKNHAEDVRAAATVALLSIVEKEKEIAELKEKLDTLHSRFVEQAKRSHEKNASIVKLNFELSRERKLREIFQAIADDLIAARKK